MHCLKSGHSTTFFLLENPIELHLTQNVLKLYFLV